MLATEARFGYVLRRLGLTLSHPTDCKKQKQNNEWQVSCEAHAGHHRVSPFSILPHSLTPGLPRRTYSSPISA
jgi:hypothetical protein